MGSIAEKWRIFSGEDSWSGILDPPENDLRRYIIHYGRMAQATRDTFNAEKASKYVGTSLYARRDMLSKVGLEQGNPFRYEVTKYIYATSSLHLPSFIIKSFSTEAWSTRSNWIGFVAVATDEGKVALGRRDIVVAWRGTVETVEWIKDLEFMLVSAPNMLRDNGAAKVHQGWHSTYTTDDPQSPFSKTSARDQVLEEVRRLVELYKNEEISLTIVGHSMGAALATLNAVDIVTNGFNKPVSMPNKACPVTAFVFASPRVGDSDFKKVVTKQEQLHILRIRNALDVVPDYPLIGYTHVGIELMVDTTKSPYLKSPDGIQHLHNMDGYLHAIAGTQGSKGGFKLEVNLDIALVNKWQDGLKDEYCVPVSWWVEKNKGMVQQVDGSWLLMDHEFEEEQKNTVGPVVELVSERELEISSPKWCGIQIPFPRKAMNLSFKRKL